MRTVLIALTMGLIPVVALAQTPQQGQVIEKAITISLPVSQWQIVLNGLGKLPLEVSGSAFSSIQAQAAKQLNPPKEEKEPKK